MNMPYLYPFANSLVNSLALCAVLFLLVFYGSSQNVGGDENPSPESEFPDPGRYGNIPFIEIINDTFGNFTSPFYPESYIQGDEQIYLFEAPENYIIHFSFITPISMEYSEGCKFDRFEVRDGRFGFSPLIARLCGNGYPNDFRTTGRYAWAYFIADLTLHGDGFLGSYEFVENYPPPVVSSQPPEPDCVFALYEQDGIISSSDIHNLYNDSGYISQTDGELDCVWEIKPFLPLYKLLFKFEVFNLRIPHDCSSNSITFYERISSETSTDNKIQYCSTYAPFVAMITNRAFVRFKAKGIGRRSSFRIIYSTYRDGPCNETLSFSCDGDICLDKHLVCNGINDCHKYALDEQKCDPEKNSFFFEKIDRMLGCMMAVIGVVIIITLCFVCRHSIRKTKKKAMVREKERKSSEQNFQNINYLMDTNDDRLAAANNITPPQHQRRDYLPLTLNPVSNGIQIESAFTYENLNGDPTVSRDPNHTVAHNKLPTKCTHQVQFHNSYKPPGYETLTYDPPT